MAEVTVGVRYCGGCNPRFDRVAGVEALKAACPGAGFHTAEPGKAYDVLLSVGGCTACCADLAGLTGREVVMIRTAGDFSRAEAAINAVCAGWTRRPPAQA